MEVHRVFSVLVEADLAMGMAGVLRRDCAEIANFALLTAEISVRFFLRDLGRESYSAGLVECLEMTVWLVVRVPGQLLRLMPAFVSHRSQSTWEPDRRYISCRS